QKQVEGEIQVSTDRIAVLQKQGDDGKMADTSAVEARAARKKDEITARYARLVEDESKSSQESRRKLEDARTATHGRLRDVPQGRTTVTRHHGWIFWGGSTTTTTESHQQ